MNIQELDQLYPHMVEWRRWLHQHPELSFKEEKTSAFIADQLTQWGIEVKKGVGGGYGVVGTIKGQSPGPNIALRADMDALPIQDKKNCDYASLEEGVMHACGHDGHVAILLGVAKYFSQHTDYFQGEIRLIFQPAEEVCPGGALSMIEDGVLDGIDAIYGLHLWTPLPVGVVGSAPGPLMASADEFFIDIHGRGGHGGIPHVAVDSIVAGAALVMQLQSIVSRSVDPLQPAVVTVGTIEGGAAQNVIAEKCRITGTVRAFDEQTRLAIRERIKALATATAQGYGASAAIDYLMGYPPLVNHEAETARFFEIASQQFGEEHVQMVNRLMPAEDFAYYLQHVPGCFMFVGAGNSNKQADYPHHHASFDIDEESLLIGAKLLAGMVRSHSLNEIT